MKTFNSVALTFSGLILLACSPDNSTKTKLFEDQRNVLDKAKEVDNIVQKQSQQLQQNVEQQSQ